MGVKTLLAIVLQIWREFHHVHVQSTF